MSGEGPTDFTATFRNFAQEVKDTLKDFSDRLSALDVGHQTLQTRLAAYEAGPSSMPAEDSPSARELRLLTLMEQSQLETSRNKDTRVLNSTTDKLGKTLYKGGKVQRYELWLQHSEHLLQTSGLDRSQWGSAIMSGLDTVPQQQVYQRLNGWTSSTSWSSRGQRLVTLRPFVTIS